MGGFVSQIDNFISENLPIACNNVERREISKRALEDWRHERVNKLPVVENVSSLVSHRVDITSRTLWLHTFESAILILEGGYLDLPSLF